jgi:predicted PurR-regulated permease PerM
MYPLHQWLARAVGRKQWLASTILVIIAFLLIIVPTGLLLNSFADSVRNFIGAVQNNTLEIPAPPERVARLSIVGKGVYDTWSKAHSDLPEFVQSMQPKIGQLAKKALAMVASIGGGLLLFLGSFIIAGIIMAHGESGSRSSKAIFQRVAGLARGEALAKLSTATIRAVALKVADCVLLAQKHRLDAGSFKAFPAVSKRSDFNHRHREHLCVCREPAYLFV